MKFKLKEKSFNLYLLIRL